MKVAIRTDASMLRGSGHVMRCLCLADALADLGHAVAFATIALPDYLHDMVLARGHEVIDLRDLGQAGRPSEEAWPYDVQAGDAAVTMASTPAELVVVDHYGLGQGWEQAVRQDGRAVMAVDDLGRRHDCDLLLDQNFYRRGSDRYAGRLPAECRQLIGPRFALMRPEFRAARRERGSGPVERVLVFVGGMDAADVTSRILDALSQGMPGGLAVDVVIGRLHPNGRAIQSRCDARQGWTCHVQTDRMAELLAAADLVIGSGGTNTWERMTVGVPALALCIADNQRTLLDECAVAGLLQVPDDDALDNVVALRAHIVSLLANGRLRQHLSAAGMALVDGAGAVRVARAAAALQRLTVRPATLSDSDLLFGWRNHESIRSVSRNKDPIALEDHRRWFGRVIADPARSLLVGERGGRPIGCVRFDENGPDSVEVSIYLAPDAMGTGTGSALLAAAEAWLAANRPHIARIDAEVLGGNDPSTHLFERAGYRPDHVLYSKGLHI